MQHCLPFRDPLSPETRGSGLGFNAVLLPKATIPLLAPVVHRGLTVASSWATAVSSVESEQLQHTNLQISLFPGDATVPCVFWAGRPAQDSCKVSRPLSLRVLRVC